MLLIIKRCIALLSLLIALSQTVWGEDMKTIQLPEPRLKGPVSVEEAIQIRRSVRSYSPKDLSIEDVSQLLWACQGITDAQRGHRAAPSAGALFPLEIYVAKAGGVFRYIPEGHKLERVSDKDVRRELAAASYGQAFVAEAGIDIIITAVYERVTSRYRERGIMYTDMEAGHAAQNVFLEAAALGLASVPVGAFDPARVAEIIKVPADRKPIYILPVGYRR